MKKRDEGGNFLASFGSRMSSTEALGLDSNAQSLVVNEQGPKKRQLLVLCGVVYACAVNFSSFPFFHRLTFVSQSGSGKSTLAAALTTLLPVSDLEKKMQRWEICAEMKCAESHRTGSEFPKMS
jgi:hypothetical protein